MTERTGTSDVSASPSAATATSTTSTTTTATDVDAENLRIQAIAATGWGYQDRTRIGAWDLRAAGGFTTRANSAWALGDSGLPLADTLAEVAAWYSARDLAPRVQTVIGGPVDRAIAELGYTETDGDALRRVADLDHALTVLRATADPDRTAEISAELPADFATVYRRSSSPYGPAVVGGGPAAPQFAVVRDPDGAPLAVGRVAVSAEHGWAGLSAIHTADHARRRGLARVVMRDLLAVAARRGATHAYLEVVADNAPALALYDALGFQTAHAYHCRVIR